MQAKTTGARTPTVGEISWTYGFGEGGGVVVGLFSGPGPCPIVFSGCGWEVSTDAPSRRIFGPLTIDSCVSLSHFPDKLLMPCCMLNITRSDYLKLTEMKMSVLFQPQYLISKACQSEICHIYNSARYRVSCYFDCFGNHH